MNRTAFFFIYSLFITVCLPPLFPHLKLMFFAPFLIFVFYHQCQISALWLALAAGLIIDLLSANTRLGFYALTYCLTTWILYKQKQHFFADSLSTLPIMTFLFASLSTTIQVGLLSVFGQSIELSGNWILNDLLWLPLQDALYAGIAFTIPCLFLPKTQRRQTLVFSPKEGLS